MSLEGQGGVGKGGSQEMGEGCFLKSPLFSKIPLICFGPAPWPSCSPLTPPVYFCLRAFALTVPYAWNTLPPYVRVAPPSPPH